VHTEQRQQILVKDQQRATNKIITCPFTKACGCFSDFMMINTLSIYSQEYAQKDLIKLQNLLRGNPLIN
jgi:hypothetical protein